MNMLDSNLYMVCLQLASSMWIGVNGVGKDEDCQAIGIPPYSDVLTSARCVEAG